MLGGDQTHYGRSQSVSNKLISGERPTYLLVVMAAKDACSFLSGHLRHWIELLAKSGVTFLGRVV